MRQDFEMIAKTFKGLEAVLADELLALGANNIQQERRAVRFTGDLALMYRANLWLRTASRVLKPILTFKATDPDQVYQQVKTINWDNYLSLGKTFTIDSTVNSEDFKHSKYVTYRVKDAIVDWFMEHYNRRPSVSLTNADIYLQMHISHDECTLCLDSSGESLHKRGWRVEQTEAPINEALAAGMLLMTGWHGETDLMDPMCGSGTFLIEAAMIALNMPPGVYRKSFAFERWADFDAELFEQIYNDDSQEREFTHKIYGSDSSHYAIKIAEKNVRSAGLQRYIQLQCTPIQTLEPAVEKGLVICNPPYGERIRVEDGGKLYDDFGKLLKHKLAGSTAWVISSEETYLQRLGLKPTKRIKLLNGSLECWFNKYELFEGKHNDYKRRQADKMGYHRGRRQW